MIERIQPLLNKSYNSIDFSNHFYRYKLYNVSAGKIHRRFQVKNTLIYPNLLVSIRVFLHLKRQEILPAEP